LVGFYGLACWVWRIMQCNEIKCRSIILSV
jgi:hypothetical protein